MSNKVRYIRNPLIAQLVERWTVVVLVIHRSLVRIRLKGLFFLSTLRGLLDLLQQMAEQQTSLIPPGVVPSESKEDLYRKLCYEENEGDTSLLKEVSSEKMY